MRNAVAQTKYHVILVVATVRVTTPQFRYAQTDQMGFNMAAAVV